VLTSARKAYTEARPLGATILLGAAALTIAPAGVSRVRFTLPLIAGKVEPSGKSEEPQKEPAGTSSK
jgi:hypothetical protein